MTSSVFIGNYNNFSFLFLFLCDSCQEIVFFFNNFFFYFVCCFYVRFSFVLFAHKQDKE